MALQGSLERQQHEADRLEAEAQQQAGPAVQQQSSDSVRRFCNLHSTHVLFTSLIEVQQQPEAVSKTECSVKPLEAANTHQEQESGCDVRGGACPCTTETAEGGRGAAQPDSPGAHPGTADTGAAAGTVGAA